MVIVHGEFQTNNFRRDANMLTLSAVQLHVYSMLLWAFQNNTPVQQCDLDNSFSWMNIQLPMLSLHFSLQHFFSMLMSNHLHNYSLFVHCTLIHGTQNEKFYYAIFNLNAGKDQGVVPAKDSWKHCLIMDEVDGMAGNEDRGGVQVCMKNVILTFTSYKSPQFRFLLSIAYTVSKVS